MEYVLKNTICKYYLFLAFEKITAQLNFRPHQPEEVSKTPHFPINTDQVMAENVVSTTRKKRPPIQLYVPPAQRKLGNLSAQKRKSTKSKSYKGSTTTEFIQLVSRQKLSDVESTPLVYCTEDLDYLNNNQVAKFSSYQCNCAKLLLFKDIFPYAKLLIFSINRIKHSFHWVKMLLADNKIIIEDSAFQLMAMYSILKNVNKVRYTFLEYLHAVEKMF